MKINNGLSFFFSQYQDDLWSLLDIRLPALLSKSNVRLVVLDSVAAIFRSEFDLHELADRAKTLAKLGNKLQRISHQYDLCVVCVNQVRLCSFKDYDDDYDDGEEEKSTGKQKKQTYSQIQHFICLSRRSCICTYGTLYVKASQHFMLLA